MERRTTDPTSDGRALPSSASFVLQRRPQRSAAGLRADRRRRATWHGGELTVEPGTASGTCPTWSVPLGQLPVDVVRRVVQRVADRADAGGRTGGRESLGERNIRVLPG